MLDYHYCKLNSGSYLFNIFLVQSDTHSCINVFEKYLEYRKVLLEHLRQLANNLNQAHLRA